MSAVFKNFLNLLPFEEVTRDRQGVRYFLGRDIGLVKDPCISFSVPYFWKLEVGVVNDQPLEFPNQTVTTKGDDSRVGDQFSVSSGIIYSISDLREYSLWATNLERSISLLSRGLVRIAFRRRTTERVSF